MAILNVQINEIGQSGIAPRIVRLETNNTRAQVIASGFLNELVNKMGIALLPTDIALVSTKASASAVESSTDWYDVVKSGDNWSLVATNANVNLASGQILVGDANGVAQGVAMSGDVAISNAGVTTIQAGAIDLAMLSAGIAPSHVIRYGGQHTTVGGGAAEAITVTGVAATDLAFVQMVDDGTNNVTIVNAVCTTNTLTVTFSGDPGNDAVINYQVINAAS